MNKKEIKLYLKDNPQLIQQILESIDCHHIKIIKDKKITAALPYPHDNTTSINIKLSDSLYTVVWTKNEFAQYEIQDFFTLIQYINQCTLNEAISLVCKVCGISYTYNAKTNSSSAYKLLQQYKRTIKKTNTLNEDEILPECYKERFIPIISQQYLDDGVNEKTQEKYDIRYDLLDNRIVFPIRNEIGSLLTFKGRTCNEEYKIRGIPKFLTYYPCFVNNYLFGYYQNKKSILESNECIIFEAEKSVMQCDSFGVNNCIAISKKRITDMQLKKILSLNVDNIILALDNDVEIEEIRIICKMFKNLKNIYYIKDSFGILKEKDSPSDLGKDMFELLLQNKVRYKGE